LALRGIAPECEAESVCFHVASDYNGIRDAKFQSFATPVIVEAARDKEVNRRVGHLGHRNLLFNELPTNVLQRLDCLLDAVIAALERIQHSEICQADHDLTSHFPLQIVWSDAKSQEGQVDGDTVHLSIRFLAGSLQKRLEVESKWS
jgi:hypothetical protein